MSDYRGDIVAGEGPEEGFQEQGGGGGYEEGYGYDITEEEVPPTPDSLHFQDYTLGGPSTIPPNSEIPLPGGSMLATVDSLGYPTSDPFPNPSDPFPNPQPKKKKKKKKKKKTKNSQPGWYELEYYEYFFNFDTSDIKDRLQMAGNPLRHATFYELSKEKPDLYVSVWATATLWFLLVVCGDMASAAIAPPEGGCSLGVEFDRIGWGFMATYCYVGFFPFLFYILLKFWIGIPDHQLSVGLCWYGYSLLPYFPTMFLGIIPYDHFRWIPFGLSCIASSYFLFLNYLHEVNEKMREGAVVLVLIVLSSVGLCVLYKMVFFDSC